MGCCGGGGNAGADARAIEAERQAQIALGKTAIDRQFSGFNEPFYNARKQAYMDYALPKLGAQRKGAERALSFSLARQGLLRSSAAEQAGRELDEQTGLSLQQITDQAAGEANQLRRDVEGQRTSLLNQLFASADPAEASKAAIAASANLRLPSLFQPIGDAFGNLATQYTNRSLANVWNNTGTGTDYRFRVAASPMPSSTNRIIKG